MNIPMNIIAAVDKSFGIGKNNQMPWHLPKEYAHFVRLTTTTRNPDMKNAVVMGRKCWESIPEKFRPLKNRVNIVLSKTMPSLKSENLIVSGDWNDVLSILAEESFKDKIETIWNVGGHDIYALGLTHPQLEKLVLTRLDKDFDCDVRFPNVNWEEFEPNNDFDHERQIEEKGIKWHITSFTRKKNT